MILVGFSTSCYLQETIILKAQVVDATSLDPLIAATILVPDSTIGVISDENGSFKIVVPRSVKELSISYVGYEQKIISIEELKEIKVVKLNRSNSYLDEITILASPVIVPLTRRVESIVDFSIENDRILFLSRKRKEGYRLKLTTFEGEVLDSFSLKKIKGIEALSTSCLQTHFLLTEYHSYQINVENDIISILHKDDRKRYDRFIASCLDANSQFFYLNAKKNYDQLSEITGFNRYSDEQVNFGQVSDDFNAKNYAEEKKYLDFMDNKGPDDWINQTTYDGLQGFYDFWEKAATLKYNFYHPVDFHLHALENSVFIIDHEKHMMQKYTLNGKVVYQYPIQYSKDQKWSGKIYTDSKTEKLYTYFIYPSKKLLFEIELSSGLLIPKASFDLAFIDNFQVYDDTIFFTNSGLVQGQEARILKRIDFGF